MSIGAKFEVRFTGKDLTTVGGMGLFHRFAKKLGVEKALEESIELPAREGKYTEGRILLSLAYAFVLDLNRLFRHDAAPPREGIPPDSGL